MLGRSLKLAFHSTALLLVGTFTIGFLFALHAGIFGIALAVMLGTWLIKYCFVLLDTGLNGNTEPPVLSIEMVNPVGEPRPLVLCLLIACMVAAVIASWLAFGPGVALPLAAVALFLIPATICSLGLNLSVFTAASPARWFEVIRILRSDYLLLLALALAGTGILYALIRFEASTWIAVAAQQLLLLLIFCAAGSALFEHRTEFGLESRSDEEFLEERNQREHQQTRQRTVDDAYVQFRHDKPKEGWRELETWLRTHAQGRQRLTEYHAILAAASRWDDPRPADRIANDLILILLHERETGSALEVAEQRFATHKKYKPAAATRLSELAGLAGKRALKKQIAATIEESPKGV